MPFDQVAAWYADHGPPVAAALAHQRIGDDATCERVLASRGALATFAELTDGADVLDAGLAWRMAWSTTCGGSRTPRWRSTRGRRRERRARRAGVASVLAEARFADAARTAGRAVRSAEPAGSPSMFAAALCNEGAALVRLCRYADAVERYERVMSLAQRMGSEWRAGALAGLGDVHRRRGATSGHGFLVGDAAHRMTQSAARA